MTRPLAVIALLVGLVHPAVAATPVVSPSTVKQVPDAEKADKSAEHMVRMRKLVDQAQGRVDDARNERDVVKLNCVNENLTQMKALTKVAERAQTAMTEALSRRDPTADTEYARVVIARSKVEGLRGQVDKCIGQLAYVVDEQTKVEVQAPEGITDRDVTDRSAPTTTAAAPPVVRPPAASAYY
ncbi:MAG: hypothetical protein QM767_03155 [Anaeromyxobacter sp.]